MLAKNEITTKQSALVINPSAIQPPTLIDRLREISRAHQICYEVCPEWSIKDGKKLQIGFELDLCGISSNEKCLHPVPGCPKCWRTYDEIREIAEWILPTDDRPSRYEIQAFDRALHVAPAKRQHRHEVIVRIVIMHRRDFNRPVDGCENHCLKEMREALQMLGIEEDRWWPVRKL